jgi:hypothetical protein
MRQAPVKRRAAQVREYFKARIAELRKKWNE